MTIVIPTLDAAKAQAAIVNWIETASQDHVWLVASDEEVGNMGYLPKVQWGYERAKTPLLALYHDDLTIHDQGWDERVERAFDDPKVGVVTFGGALAHGHPDIYKLPYEVSQLGRSHWLSNDDNAEAHGRRFTGECDVAVADSYSLIMRREILDNAGPTEYDAGWPVNRYAPSHCSDYWLCLTAHKLGYRVRFVGVAHYHVGGSGTTDPRYREWAKTTKWGSDMGMHEYNHKLIYEEFRGVLPVVCPWPDGLEV